MKSWFLLLLFLLAFKLNAHSQDNWSITDTKVANKIADFKSKGVSKYICYYMECIGGFWPYRPDSCVAHNKKYLVWNENGKSYRQRFDECRNYSAELIADSMFNIINIHYGELKKDSIKYPQHYELVNGKKHLLTSIVDHSCVTSIEIYWGSQKLIKKIDNYATDTQYLDGYNNQKFLNINYKPNKRTFLYKLYLLTQKM